MARHARTYDTLSKTVLCKKVDKRWLPTMSRSILYVQNVSNSLVRVYFYVSRILNAFFKFYAYVRMQSQNVASM